jgi:hypothetical protein
MLMRVSILWGDGMMRGPRVGVFLEVLNYIILIVSAYFAMVIFWR